MKYLNKFADFMHGRYGVDELTKFLFYFYLIVTLINIFIKSYILTLIELTFIMIIFYRTLSKKIYKRSNENKKFVNLFNMLKSRNKLKNTDTHIYKKCHHCGCILRLPIPSKKGIKYVRCPDCKKRNRFIILKSEKIEIIKNKN